MTLGENLLSLFHQEPSLFRLKAKTSKTAKTITAPLWARRPGDAYLTLNSCTGALNRRKFFCDKEFC